VVLQVRTAVEPEQLGGRLAAFLQKDPDHINRHGANVHGPIDRTG
jgi:hypothetical protein